MSYKPTIGVLLDMLTYCRPHGTVTEQTFLNKYVVPLVDSRDHYGNYHKVIPTADGAPSRVLWSCHTDTVHWADGRQTLRYDAKDGRITLSKASRRYSNCLGADDTAGVFILLGMIVAKVPGHYVFHYGEESGGIGSSNLAYDSPEVLADLDCAIALDRRGTTDIITHQYGGRTCSDLFALSLAEEIARVSPLKYGANRGVYTDTAEYADLIPECTNLSVGYAREHSSDESLQSRHVFALLACLTALDTAALFIDRDPTPEPISWRTTRADYDRDTSLPVIDVLTDDDETDLADLADTQGDSYTEAYLSQVYKDVQDALQRSQAHHDRCKRCHARLHGQDECLCKYRRRPSAKGWPV